MIKKIRLFVGKKWFRRTLLIALLVSIISPFVADWLVDENALNRTTHNLEKVPEKKVGLLLGTSRMTSRGSLNPFYMNRIEATVQLFKAGKIKFILISGDNGHMDYNEPEMMKADLIARGIPANRIELDFAGFRTLDSVVRCKEVFGESDIILISQQFHNERALYLADHFGVKAFGFNAADVNGNSGLKTKIREKFARVKLLIDLFFGVEPRFYGSKIKIG